jgi:hypothetical protein
MSKPERYPRRQSTLYAALLTLAFGLSYVAVMYIPLVYDSLNLRIFNYSVGSGNLIIQEHSSLTETILNKQCEGIGKCDFGTFFHILEHKRMVSLDYASQMRRAGELSIIDFLIRSVGFLIPTLIVIFMVARFMDGQGRSILLVSLFMVSLALFPIISGLPHSNGKFYYIFGTAFSVLIAVSDGLNAFSVPSFADNVEAGLKNDALAVIHQKWTRLLVLSLTIAVVFIGTISVTLWGYMNAVFGYSFSFFPFVGVLISIALILSIFYLGILRSILRIQEEIEGAMGACRV